MNKNEEKLMSALYNPTVITSDGLVEESLLLSYMQGSTFMRNKEKICGKHPHTGYSNKTPVGHIICVFRFFFFFIITKMQLQFR